MKILFAVWELAPFFKVGGLGDIARSLPSALSKLNIDIRVILPFYQDIKLFSKQPKKVAEFNVDFDNKKNKTTIYEISFIKEKIPVYLLKNADYLDNRDNETFSFFNLAVVALLKNKLLNWTPNIIHGNDHHTGLIPLIIKHQKLPFKTLTTIHNLDNQGKTPLKIFLKMGIYHKNCQVVKWESQDKDINFLLEAIVHSDIINTVSPTYAKEILTEEYSAGLHQILNDQKYKIYGILNGLDENIKNPANDSFIKFSYNRHQPINSILKNKKLNKTYLQKKLGLKIDEKIPLIGFIGRLSAKQKGIDLLYNLIKKMSNDQYQFVVLGKGNEEWQEKFQWFNRFYRQSVSCNLLFDEALASQIYAGADFLTIPSKYEPCGLIQMIAMRYGTLPIARATGGLKDTITNEVNGFLFNNYSVISLEKAVKHAVDVWKNHQEKYQKMVTAAMAKDFSWNKSAKKYLKLYEKLIVY